MSRGKGKPDASRCAGPLMLRLPAEISEYLRREAASRTLDPLELASRLLMRGLHAERLDDFADALDSPDGWGGISADPRLAAGLEAGALLGALSAWQDAPVGEHGASCETTDRAARELLERARAGRIG